MQEASSDVGTKRSRQDDVSDVSDVEGARVHTEMERVVGSVAACGCPADEVSAMDAFFGGVDDLVRIGVLAIQNQETFKAIKEEATRLFTPRNSPILPDAPIKAERLDQPIRNVRNVEGGPPGVKRRLILEDEEEEEEEEVVVEIAKAPLHLVNATTAGVAVPYDPTEHDPIARAFQASIDALVTNSVERKQYLLEEIARALVGSGTLEEYKERLRDTGHTWVVPE